MLNFIILMGSGVVASLYYSNREFFLLLPLREKGPLGSEIVASRGAEAYRLMIASYQDDRPPVGEISPKTLKTLSVYFLGVYW